MAKLDDILQIIPMEELPLLSALYKKHLPYASHVYSFINTTIKWMTKCPNSNYITIMAPGGDWKNDGTFVALLQFFCYDIVLFTFDKSCTKLYHALKETKQINWNEHILFFALHEDQRDCIYKVLHDKNIPVHYETKTHSWFMEREMALDLKFTCPDDMVLDDLKPEDAVTIDDVWPFRYTDSTNYIKTMIVLSGGHGLYRKSDGRLVSWVLKNHMGYLGQLQTDDAFKRKGYGSIVTLSLSKEIAQDGHHPLGTVLENNDGSRKMFASCGFRILNAAYFIGTGYSKSR